MEKEALIFYQILSTSCSRKMYGDQTAELACDFKGLHMQAGIQHPLEVCIQCFHDHVCSSYQYYFCFQLKLTPGQVLQSSCKML